MTTEHEYQQIDILIPGYSIEDLPTDLTEKSAASLLNAFSVAWHPQLLLAANCVPEFRQAESTELPTGQHIVFVPECSEDWLGHDWEDHFTDTLSAVLSGCSDRADYIRRISEIFPEAPVVSDELLSHFFALGTCHLQVMLLSRKMHHFVDPDSYLLQSESLDAARAALAGDEAAAKDHLRKSFECLLDCREQFYPVECFLIDTCLPSDQTTSSELTALIDAGSPVSLICSGGGLQKYAEDQNFQTSVSTAVAEKRLSLLTGQQHELRTSLGSLSTLYSDLNSIPVWLRQLPDNASLHWARRRFGMTSSLPSILSHFDFASALHVVLDDGLYPDREYGQLNWQANDGTTISSVSRIPVAIDGASSFLRFADRYTESMQEDTNAVMLLARLPQVQTPWLHDLQLASEYSPVLGKFVTMTDFIDQTSGQSSATKFGEGEYLSPYLIQSAVLKTEAPISSPQELYQLRDRLEMIGFLECISAMLKPRERNVSQVDGLEATINQEEITRIDLTLPEPEDSARERTAEISTRIRTAQTDGCNTLSRRLPGTEGVDDGYILMNPLPWKRQVSIQWPKEKPLPSESEHSVEAWQQNGRTFLSAELPAGGFLRLQSSAASRSVVPQKAKGKPLAEVLLLRNQFFELNLSEKTGGIAELRFHNQRANRLSQQTSFRYESSKTVAIDGEEMVCPYAATRMVSTNVVDSGPFVGCVETSNEIVDVLTEDVLAKFRQTFAVRRDNPTLELTIDFDEIMSPLTGNPWMTYFASRFAWDNEGASITRSMLGQAAGFRMERFDAPDYIEVADSDQRLLIIPHGRPYHRRSGRRMLDSLLLVEGEDQRSFKFTLDFDQPFPMRRAMEANRPPLLLPTENRVARNAASGWLMGASAKNVVIARSRLIPTVENATSIVLLLQETEGRRADCRLLTVRPPQSARVRKPDGTTIRDLDCSSGAPTIEFSAFQMKEVELTF